MRTDTLIELLRDCELVIEAAPEDLDLKRNLFERLASVCGPETVLATNTSSLSVTAIASAVPEPQRIVGMHFFNPPALMQLVEIVAGDESGEPALELATEVARGMGRTPIRARDSVGFVANRCVRPFFLESLRMLAEGVAPHDEIDRIVRLGAGLRMGPFELMDLIGIDVNFAVARSFWEQSFGEPRWRPDPYPRADGRLGPARAKDRPRLLHLRDRRRRTARATPTSEGERPIFDEDRAGDGRRTERPRGADAAGIDDRQRGLLRAGRAGGLGGRHQHRDAPRLQLADRLARVGRASWMEPCARSPRVSCAIFRARRIDRRRYSETGLAASSSRVHRRRCPGSRPSTESQDPARIRARPPIVVTVISSERNTAP